MASTYTVNLGIEKIGTGEQSGTWGTTTNTNFDLIDQAINGAVTVTLASAGTSGSPNTLAITDGTVSDGRNKFIDFADGGDLGAAAYIQLTPNDAEKLVHIRNSLSGGRSIFVFQGTYNASNDFEIPNGKDVVLKFDGGGATATVTQVFEDLLVTAVAATTVDTTNIEVTNLKAKDGTSAGSIADSTGVVTLASSVLTTTDINGGSVDGVTLGTNSAVTEAQIDNININGNTISSTDTNGNVTITPDGTGSVAITKIDVAGGEIDGTAIGANSASTAVFTDLTASGTVSFSGATVSDGGTVTTVNIDGGSIDGTIIGAATPAAGSFTTGQFGTSLNVDGTVTADGLTVETASDPAQITLRHTGNTSGLVIKNFSGAEAQLVNVDNGPMVFKTNDNEAMRIDSAGNTTITNTGAGAGAGPYLNLHRNSASPLAGDAIGVIQFQGEDSVGNLTSYATIDSEIYDPNNGTEDGRLVLKTAVAGSLANRLYLNFDETVFNEDSNNLDFRVESDNKSYMFYIDAGTDTAYFGGSDNRGFVNIEKDAPLASAGAFTSPHIALQALTQPTDNDGFVGMSFATSDSDNYGFTIGAQRTTGGQGNLVFRNHFNDASGTELMALKSGAGVVINEDGGDIDFRVESDTNTHALFVDGGGGHVNIHNSSDLGATLNVDGAAFITGSGTTISYPTNARFVVEGGGATTDRWGDGSKATVAIRSKEMTLNEWYPTLHITTIRQSLTTGKDATGGIGFTTIDDSNAQGIDDAARIEIYNVSPSSRNSATAMRFWANPGGALYDVAPRQVASLSTTETVFNEDSYDQDFRVESDSNTHMLFVDAGNNVVGINNASPSDAATMLSIGGDTISTAKATVSIVDSNSSLHMRGGSPLIYFDVTGGGQGTICTDGTAMYIKDGDIDSQGNTTHVFGSSTSGTTVVNESSQDIDFRVESANDTHALFVDAGNDRTMFGRVDVSAGTNFCAIDAAPNTSGHVIRTGRDDTTTKNHIVFINPNGTVGSIQTAASATSYNTSSDARLKENIADADDAGELIDAIQVRQFDWKADGSHQRYGMVAQELLEVAPEAVSQPEDPEEMMGVDYSKLVPMLIKEIQSLRARVAQLEGA